MAPKKLTTHRIPKGKILYAERGTGAKFEDVQRDQVPDLYVGAALMTLQTADVNKEIADVLVDVPDMGRVCVTAVRKRCGTATRRYYLWTAVKAVMVESDSPLKASRRARHYSPSAS